MAILLFIAGLFFLIFGADILIRGASRLALSIGITPLVIGLTVVSFGTSAPELAVSAQAALANQANLSVGNVIGSNIFNILVVLGISALIAPLLVSPSLIRRDIPIMISVSVIAYIFMFNEKLSFVEGVILFSILIVYLLFLIKQSRREQSDVKPDEVESSNSKIGILKYIGFIIVGLIMLTLGSNWLVDSSIKFAKYFEVSELIIGLTIVAIGTSLPEVVTSVIATIRGERDIAVGNVIGSNIFNILGVFGVVGIFSPHGVDVFPNVIQFDLPFMIVVALLCIPIFISGHTINRWEGLLLFSIYIIYTAYLILKETESTMLPQFYSLVCYFVIPIFFLFLIIDIILKNKLKLKNTTSDS